LLHKFQGGVSRENKLPGGLAGISHARKLNPVFLSVAIGVVGGGLTEVTEPSRPPKNQTSLRETALALGQGEVTR
jgi:hypothetical protein